MARLSRISLSLGILMLLTLVSEARVPTNSGLGIGRIMGTHFVVNGSPFYFNGFNSYWMMHVAAEPGDRSKVSKVFREAAAAGLFACRTWACWKKALDFVISEAQKYGIRLILSFANNYNDFGGRAQYVRWTRNAGVQVNSNDDFYTHSVLKEYYKNHAKRVITRFNTITRTAYKDDPTIMAWELMNEPRCQADYSGRTINPLVIAEFGKTSKDPGYNLNSRDSFMNVVYANMDSLGQSGGIIGGSLVWQLVEGGMEPYHDGYEIVLSENSSIDGVLSKQSRQMAEFSHLTRVPHGQPRGKRNSMP
ncbi:glycosyl hydrolase superfamily protein [Actinidia rufa]|uniref:mannan endo-1,4-beta-mannosidase n=1 Tax=Actinidia rufa TaxID=165716 RepID=A0A7J0FEI3_9ERIC|nr:glycosyl hydrolase superfamily protein [Actinidia rufa]